jgi:hypothetical protein
MHEEDDMKKLALVFSLLVLAVFISAQDSKPPKLTDAQILDLIHSRDAVNTVLEKAKLTPEWKEAERTDAANVAALNKLKATATWKEVDQAQSAYLKARSEALKGLDPKKWQLGNDFQIVPVPPEKAAEPEKK